MNKTTTIVIKRNDKLPVNAKKGRSYVYSSYNPRRNPSLKPFEISKKSKEQQDKDNFEMETYRNRLLANLSFTGMDLDILKKLINYLRELARTSADKGNYADAESSRNLVEEVRKQIIKLVDHPAETKGLVVQQTARKSDLETKCKEEIDNYDQETAAKVQHLEEKHKREMIEFEDLWRNKMPHKYRKPTTQLLQLKQIEKSLAVSGEYGRAKEISQQAQALSLSEQEHAQTMLVNDYQASLQKINEKHKVEMSLLVHTRFQGKEVLLSKQSNERKSVINRELVIKEKLSSMPPKKVGAVKSIIQPVSRSASNERKKVCEVLLPALKPPNDPEFIEEFNRKKKEILKKKLEYQEHNAKELLSKYSLESMLGKDVHKDTLNSVPDMKDSSTQHKTNDDKDKNKKNGGTKDQQKPKNPKSKEEKETKPVEEEEMSKNKSDSISQDLKQLPKQVESSSENKKEELPLTKTDPNPENQNETSEVKQKEKGEDSLSMQKVTNDQVTKLIEPSDLPNDEHDSPQNVNTSDIPVNANDKEAQDSNPPQKNQIEDDGNVPTI